MRRIYTSPRMANVERVVELMRRNGIETSMANRRAWQADDWKRFSYSARGNSESWPQVWVVRSEDQTRARQLLRDAGLEPSTRFADELAATRGVGDMHQHRAVSARVKLVVLALILGVLVLIAMQQLGS
jgi:hypothetical protein